MTSQAGTQTITINILADISKIMQNHAENEFGRQFKNSFLFLKKALYEAKACG